MSCNSESRRAINYSLHEPSNKYDLWLSENLRYNSEGWQIYDSPGQPACDLILKIYKDGDWKPIAGINTEHIVANKINVVQEHYLNHLPLFKDPYLSPDELFDAGTVGQVIKQYVTKNEWLNIFLGDAFTLAFKYYFPTIIHNGGITINNYVDPAGADFIGGIWADEFNVSDLFPASQHNYHYTDDGVLESYNWIALAKYKPNHGTSDYNLYVSARDIIGAINHYLINNPEAPGIQPGSDFEWRFADTENVGGIYADKYGNSFQNAFKPVEIKFYPDDWHEGMYKGRLSVNAHDVLDALNDIWQQNPNTLVVNTWKGLDTELREGHPGVWVGIDGVNIENSGLYPKINQTGDGLEWVDLDVELKYPILSSENAFLYDAYVIKGKGAKDTYLDCDGNWTKPTGDKYYGTYFIGIDGSNYVSIKPYIGSDKRRMYLSSYQSTAEWYPIEDPISYSGISPIYVSNGEIGIRGTDNKSDVLCSDGQFGVEWRLIQAGESLEAITYSEGIGINVDNDEHIISIDIDGAIDGQVLSYTYDGTNSDIAWVDLTSYEAGDGIDITNNTISSKISVNEILDLAPEDTIIFNSVLQSAGNQYTGIKVTEDSTEKCILKPFSYTKINIKNDNKKLGSNITIEFRISNQIGQMYGNPIFVEFNLEVPATCEIKVVYENNNTDTDGVYIDSNQAIDPSSNTFKCTNALVTMQFGIVKFEVITQYEPVTQLNEPEA